MIWMAIGRCRKCLAVIRTADTTFEPPTRPMRRARRLQLHGPQKRIILSIGVSHFDFFHRWIQLLPSLFLIVIFVSFRFSLGMPGCSSVRLTHAITVMTPLRAMNFLCRLASLLWKPWDSSATRKHERMRIISVAGRSSAHQNRHWQDPIG